MQIYLFLGKNQNFAYFISASHPLKTYTNEFTRIRDLRTQIIAMPYFEIILNAREYVRILHRLLITSANILYLQRQATTQINRLSCQNKIYIYLYTYFMYI